MCRPAAATARQIDVDRDHHVAGETAQVLLQVDNQSSEKFKAVEVRWLVYSCHAALAMMHQ